MLALSRKIGETIVIDGRIKIQVVGIMGNRVRLGIEAPDDVLILRGEIANLLQCDFISSEAAEENESVVACR